jgi:neurofibromin 1
MSAAIQTRAFIVMGTLATSDVDDDLLYQMLVAFKTALSHSSETNTTAVVSMLRCICKIVPALVENSRYICQVFWLAVALLQSSHIAFYIEATNLLQTTLESMERRGMLQPGSNITAVLLDGRSPLEEVACQLDQLLGLSFDYSFSFSLASIIFKGVRLSGLKDSAEAVLRSLLRVTVRGHERQHKGIEGFRQILCPDALGYFIALLPLSTTPATYRQLLEDCDLAPSWLPEPGSSEGGVPRVSFGFIGLDDPSIALLLVSFVGAILTSAQGDDAETEILFNLLSDVAALYPDIVSMT